MKKLFAILVLSLTFLIISPMAVLAATNYGDGTYGAGVYNVGETPAPTSAPASVSTTSDNSSAGAPQCSDSAPSGAPNLFEIHTAKDSATLYFAPPVMPYSKFYIAFSRKADSWEYGTEYNQGYSGGVLRVTINKLSPNTKYYFKIRPGNGCATGNYSNTMTAVTTSSTSSKTYYKNILTTVIQQVKNFISKITTSTNKTGVSQTPIPTYIPILTSQPEAVTQPVINQPAVKKFCILWWCF